MNAMGHYLDSVQLTAGKTRRKGKRVWPYVLLLIASTAVLMVALA